MTVDAHLAPGNRAAAAEFRARHFRFDVTGKVGVVTLDRPERKNPLTFDSYAELRDLFRLLARADDVRAVVVKGAGENFCSGGDVHEIIGPLTQMAMPDLMAFTRMTGDVVKAMRACPQPIVAAIDGVCAGAGAILAMASDVRIGSARSKVAFLFSRVGLAGCDMGACAMLPRIIGQGRAAELLYTGRAISGEEALAWGFYNRLAEPDALGDQRRRLGRRARRRADVRPRHDQAHASPGVGDGRRRGDRVRSAGAGDLHDDPGLPPRLPSVRRQDPPGLRGRLVH